MSTGSRPIKFGVFVPQGWRMDLVDIVDGSADLDQFRRKLEILKGHCENVGRDYNEIVRSTGADYFIVSLPRIAYDQTPLDDFAREVVPRFS